MESNLQSLPELGRGASNDLGIILDGPMTSPPANNASEKNLEQDKDGGFNDDVTDDQLLLADDASSPPAKKRKTDTLADLEARLQKDSLFADSVKQVRKLYKV